MQGYKLVITCLGLLFLHHVSHAQVANSPYSRLGLGDLTDENFNHLRQMGGLGTSYLDPYHINIVNPASQAHLRATAFDLGLFARYSQFKDASGKANIWQGNLEYLALAFPLYNPLNEVFDGVQRKFKLAMSFSFRPYSFVSYNLVDTTTVNGSDGQVASNFVGSGGTYKALWGNSVKYKNYSLGVNLGYIFGNILYQRASSFYELPSAYTTIFSNDYSVRGFTAGFGFIYDKTLNEKAILADKNTPSKRISIGIAGNLTSSLNMNSLKFDRGVQSYSGIGSLVDTFYYGSADYKGRTPSDLSIGATYYNGEKSAIGIDLKKVNWSTYYNEANNQDTGEYEDGFKVALGGFVRPNYKDYSKYFQRVYYRYGAYYENEAKKVEDVTLKGYGVTFGLGMPVAYQRKISHVNIGATLGQRGQNTSLSENFVKFSFGVTFNDDEWFLKRKYY